MKCKICEMEGIGILWWLDGTACEFCQMAMEELYWEQLDKARLEISRKAVRSRFR